jgi:hypothetical protein
VVDGYLEKELEEHKELVWFAQQMLGQILAHGPAGRAVALRIAPGNEPQQPITMADPGIVQLMQSTTLPAVDGVTALPMTTTARKGWSGDPCPTPRPRRRSSSSDQGGRMNESLHEHANYVDNAFLLLPVRPFFPESTVLGFYTFLPGVATGIAQGVVAPPSGTRGLPDHGRRPGRRPERRGHTELARPWARRRAHDQPEAGDPPVPADGHTLVEDSSLAHIEFDRPNFRRIFRPAAPLGDRLVPRVSLVALRPSRATRFPPADGRPAHMQTTMSELQPLEDAWAWAHAQIVGPPAQDDTTGFGERAAHRSSTPRRTSRGWSSPAPRPRRDLPGLPGPTYDAGVHVGLTSPDEGAWTSAGPSAQAGRATSMLAEKIIARPAPWRSDAAC